jgi:hypothetical protein
MTDLVSATRIIRECLTVAGDDIQSGLAAAEYILLSDNASTTSTPPATDERTQDILNDAMEAARGISSVARQSLEELLGSDSIPDGEDVLAFVEDYRRELTNLLTSAQLASLLVGAREVAAKVTQLDEDLATVGPLPSPAFSTNSNTLTIKEAARILAEKNVLTRQEYDALDAQARSKAIMVAGIDSKAVLTKIRDAMAEAVGKGGDYKTFRTKVLAAVDSGTTLSESHLERMFRTNVQSAFSDGQMAVLQNPVVRGGFPYVAYEAIHDDRTRHDHLHVERSGIGGTNVYRTDDPVFRVFRPPWDWNCRCSWNPITTRQAAEAGIKEAQDWLETGQEPTEPAYVAMPPFAPPAEFQRTAFAIPLSIQLSEMPMREFGSDTGYIERQRPGPPYTGTYPRDKSNRYIDKKRIAEAARSSTVADKLRSSVPDEHHGNLDNAISHLQSGGTVHHPSEPPGMGINTHGAIADVRWAVYDAHKAARTAWEQRSISRKAQRKAAESAVRALRKDKPDWSRVDELLQAAGATPAEMRSLARARHYDRDVESAYENMAEAIHRRIDEEDTKDIDVGVPEEPADAALSTDAQGHEHKGKGPGGGQFVSKNDRSGQHSTNTNINKEYYDQEWESITTNGDTGEIESEYRYSVGRLYDWARENIKPEFISTSDITGVFGTGEGKDISDEPDDSPEFLARAEASDLRYPLLLVRMQDGYLEVADGRHRLKKAMIHGIDSIAAYIIDVDNLPRSAALAMDAEGHDHKGKGPGGGQFVKKGGGGSSAGGNDGPDRTKPERATGRTRHKQDTGSDARAGGQMEGKVRGSSSEADGGIGANKDQPIGTAPAGDAAPTARPARRPRVTKASRERTERVNRRIRRIANALRNEGREYEADWLDDFRQTVNYVGVDMAAKELGDAKERTPGEKVQYSGSRDWEEETEEDEAQFIKEYLDQTGIIIQSGSTFDPSMRTIAAAPIGDKTDYKAKEGDYVPTDAKVVNQSKLVESKMLPGLESTEDINVIVGKEVTGFTPEVMSALDSKYGEGKWIVKSYGDESYAGFGVFFPQRIKQMHAEARDAILDTERKLRRYGYTTARDNSGKIVGITNSRGNGSPLAFGTSGIASIPDKNVRKLAAQMARHARSEDGVQLPMSSEDQLYQDYGIKIRWGKGGEADGVVDPFGENVDFGTPKYDRMLALDGYETGWAYVIERALSWKGERPKNAFMAQPAFQAVGVTEEDRAYGATYETSTEGRVHIVVKDGRASVIPYATLASRSDSIPVTISTDDTRAMEAAAQATIDALPESERVNQVYAPDVIKTTEGWRAVELNPSTEFGSSGWLEHNPLVIDAYVSHITGREPAHVAFMRSLLADRLTPGKSGPGGSLTNRASHMGTARKYSMGRYGKGA